MKAVKIYLLSNTWSVSAHLIVYHDPSSSEGVEGLQQSVLSLESFSLVGLSPTFDL